MASAPAPTRDTIFYHKVDAYKPKFNEIDQCYCDYKITLREFNARGKAIKCGLCDYEHIFYKPENFNQHLKSDKHQKKLKEYNDRHRIENPPIDVTEVTSDVSEAGSTITTETPIPELTPVESVPPPTPTIQPTQDLYHTILMTEIDRLNQVIRQRDAQIGHLKQTIIHFSEYLRYEEAL